MSSSIIDPFGRTIDYLRVSVTDRCNYRCNYCMPPQGYHPDGHHSEYLSFNEIHSVVSAFAALGLKKVRLTGGEPLVRKKLPELVAALSDISQLEDISLSTNAHHLAKHAQPLFEAGLHRVNVSLDSLIPEKFKRITRGGDLNAVLKGIASAQAAGLTPIKVNCVMMKNVNDDEIESMTDWAMKHAIELRFIEIMPIGAAGIAQMDQHISAQTITERLEAHFKTELIPTVSKKGSGPAKYYTTKKNQSRVGIISAVSQHFCASCNRVRLTARGQLALCLGQENSFDLRTPLRDGIESNELQALITKAITHKPERHFFNENRHNIEFREMVSLGG